MWRCSCVFCCPSANRRRAGHPASAGHILFKYCSKFLQTFFIRFSKLGRMMMTMKLTAPKHRAARHTASLTMPGPAPGQGQTTNKAIKGHPYRSVSAACFPFAGRGGAPLCTGCPPPRAMVYWSLKNPTAFGGPQKPHRIRREHRHEKGKDHGPENHAGQGTGRRVRHRGADRLPHAAGRPGVLCRLRQAGGPVRRSLEGHLPVCVRAGPRRG